MSTPNTAAERFQAFQAHHGPLSGPLTDRILGIFFDKAIHDYFEYPSTYSGQPLAVVVAEKIKRQAPDILSVIELAADWAVNPMVAAERQLRDDLDAKTQAELRARKREEEEATAAAIRAKADAFMEALKRNAESLEPQAAIS